MVHKVNIKYTIQPGTKLTWRKMKFSKNAEEVIGSKNHAKKLIIHYN